MPSFTNADLEAYLDEALPAEEMALIEQALRENGPLVESLLAIHARRQSGIHTLAEIWRRHRLSCPTRDQLGSYLLKVLPKSFADFITFHLEVTGCPLCKANLTDLQSQQTADPGETESRRRRYFQSTAGYLPRQE